MNASRRQVTGRAHFWHPTSAEGLAGEPLDAAEAAARSFGAEPGFYLATSFEDAMYFGSLHTGFGGKVAVIEYRLTPTAIDSLLGANSRLEPMPQGGAESPFEGQQLFVPTEDFGLFNDLRAGGDIMPVVKVNMQPDRPGLYVLPGGVEAVRRLEKFFFGDDGFSARRAIDFLSREAAVSGIRVEVISLDGWWVLSAEQDWLPPENVNIRVPAVPDAICPSLCCRERSTLR